MTESAPESPIESFKLTMRLDATLTVDEKQWFKPGIEGAISWRRLPTQDELKAAATYIQFHVIDPVITENIATISAQLEEDRKSRNGK